MSQSATPRPTPPPLDIDWRPGEARSVAFDRLQMEIDPESFAEPVTLRLRLLRSPAHAQALMESVTPLPGEPPTPSPPATATATIPPTGTPTPPAAATPTPTTTPTPTPTAPATATPAGISALPTESPTGTPAATTPGTAVPPPTLTGTSVPPTSLPATPTPTAAPTSTPVPSVPAVPLEPSPPIPAHLTAPYLFSIEARTGAGKLLRRLNRPVRLAVDFGDLSPADWGRTFVNLYYFDEGSGRWAVVPGQTDMETRRVAVELDHFTAFALAGDENAQPSIPPNLEDFQVDLCTGYARAGVALKVPPVS